MQVHPPANDSYYSTAVRVLSELGRSDIKSADTKTKEQYVPPTPDHEVNALRNRFSISFLINESPERQTQHPPISPIERSFSTPIEIPYSPVSLQQYKVSDNGTYERRNSTQMQFLSYKMQGSLSNPSLPPTRYHTPPLEKVFFPEFSESKLSEMKSRPLQYHRRKSSIDSVDESGQKKIFPCTFDGCTAVFTRSYNLKSHSLCHSREKPHSCEICPASFARKHDLQRHIRKLHKVEPPKCVKCNQMFAGQNSLKKHLLDDERITKEEYSSLYPIVEIITK